MAGRTRCLAYGGAARRMGDLQQEARFITSIIIYLLAFYATVFTRTNLGTLGRALSIAALFVFSPDRGALDDRFGGLPITYTIKSISLLYITDGIGCKPNSTSWS